MPSTSGGAPRLQYRNCEKFRWRDDLGRVPPEMVDDMWSKKAQISERPSSLKCNGLACSLRDKPRAGNRSCSNQTSCKDCCERAQKEGAPQCSYSSHNPPSFSFADGLSVRTKYLECFYFTNRRSVTEKGQHGEFIDGKQSPIPLSNG